MACSLHYPFLDYIGAKVGHISGVKRSILGRCFSSTLGTRPTCSSPSSCLGTSLSPAAAEMARLVQLPATLTLACNPNNTTQVRLAELSVTGSLRSTKKLAQHRGPAHKMTLLPDSPYIVLSAGEDGQVLFIKSC